MYTVIAMAIVELLRFIFTLVKRTKEEIAKEFRIRPEQIENLLLKEIKIWKKNSIYPIGLVRLYLDTINYKKRIQTEEDAKDWRKRMLMYFKTVWYLPFFTNIHRRYKGNIDRSLVDNDRYVIHVWYWDSIGRTDIYDKVRKKAVRYDNIQEEDYKIVVEVATKMATTFNDQEGLIYLINNLDPQKHYRYILWGMQVFRVGFNLRDLDIPVEERKGFLMWR